MTDRLTISRIWDNKDLGAVMCGVDVASDMREQFHFERLFLFVQRVVNDSHWTMFQSFTLLKQTKNKR